MGLCCCLLLPPAAGSWSVQPRRYRRRGGGGAPRGQRARGAMGRWGHRGGGLEGIGRRGERGWGARRAGVGSGCRAPESSEHGVLVVPAAVGTADRALGVPAPGGSGEEERWGGLSARRGDAAPGGSGRQGEWALRGTGCWTPGGANTGGAETLRAAGRRCLVQSGALGLPGVGRLWGAGGQRGRQGSAGPASLLGEQPLGCKGAVAFWSSLGVAGGPHGWGWPGPIPTALPAPRKQRGQRNPAPGCWGLQPVSIPMVPVPLGVAGGLFTGNLWRWRCLRHRIAGTSRFRSAPHTDGQKLPHFPFPSWPSPGRPRCLTTPHPPGAHPWVPPPQRGAQSWGKVPGPEQSPGTLSARMAPQRVGWVSWGHASTHTPRRWLLP